MNKQVYKTALWLVVGLLVFQYVLKIFFPQQFVLAISNPQIIKIGEYIDNHVWANLIACTIITVASNYLFISAVTGCLKATRLKILLIIVDLFIERALYYADANNNIYTWYVYCDWLIMALLSRANVKETVIVYSVNFLAQALSLDIRNIAQYVSNRNFAIFFILAIECYFWLLLFCLFFNNKECNHGVDKTFVRGRNKILE